jgi:hypothetical protein
MTKRSSSKNPRNARKKIIKRKIFKKKITRTVTKTTTTRTVRVIKKRIITRQKKYKMANCPPRFRAWKCDDTVIDVLKSRGWKYLGEPCKNGRENYPKSMFKAKSEGKIKGDECLYWCDDDDTRVLQGLSSTHMLSSLPGSARALTKPHQQEMFNEYSWFPNCFTLPKEKPLMETYLKKNPNSYWIAKPRDSYGGFGMCVFKAGSMEFKKTLNRKTTFVVQEYLKNPYLLAGLYKFHVRAYMVITNARDPLKAYLYKDAQIQFSTHKYDLNQIEKNFNKYSHITNYKVNNEKKNMNKVLENKPGIGRGTEWSIKTFIAYMKKHEPKFSEIKFWKQCADMAKVAAEKIEHQNTWLVLSKNQN